MRRGKEDMIARQAETDMLLGILDAAGEGKGQFLLLEGEAGIGKTAMVEVLSRRAAETGMTVCRGDCTRQDSGMPYRVLQDALASITDSSIFSLEDFAFFDEVFLISKVGLLISHVSRSQDRGMDEDILGSMLTAVQDFVKDSFGEGGSEGGGLGKLEYMDTKIMIEHGDSVYLAAVISGEEHPDMRRDLKKCLSRIEETYFDILAEWDGDLDALSGAGDMLEGVVGARYRVKRQLESINLDSERLKVQDRVLGAIEGAADGGLVLVLEDMHWADESSLLTLPYLARNISDGRILICVTYRPEALDANPGAGEVMDGLAATGTCRKLTLGPLNEAAVTELASHELGGDEPPEELVAGLVSGSGGNPLFIIEAVRTLAGRGQLVKDGEVWVLRHGPGAEIPDTVMGMVARRLEELEPDCLLLLEYGAVLGRKFDRRVLLSGFGMEERHATEALDTLVSMDFLEEGSAEGVMRFQHSTVQEAIYTSMGDRWKLVLHRSAGLALEARYSGDIEEGLFDLAYHFSRTNDLDRGIEYCVSAGYKAMNNFAPKEAIGFFRRGIELIEEGERDEDDPRYPELHDALGEVYELDGNLDAALETYEKLAAMSGPGGSAEPLMKCGRVLLSRGKYDEAVEMLNRALGAAREGGRTMQEARIDGYLGKIYLRRGKHREALDLQRTYLNISRMLGENMDMARAHMNMGGVYWQMCDYPMAVSSWQESLKLFTEMDYKQGIANVNDNLGVAYCSGEGNYEKALEHYTRAAGIMKEIGDIKGISMVWNNLGVLYDRTGEMELALEYFRKSLRLKKKMGDLVGQANLYNNIGVIHFYTGEYREALEDYATNLGLMEECGDTRGVAKALANMAEVEIEMELHDSAEEHCARSERLAREHGFKDILAATLMHMANLEFRRGGSEEAEKLLAESLAMSREAREPEVEGKGLLLRARMLREAGETGRAVDAYASAMKLFEENGMVRLGRMTRREMQELAGGVGD